ncbi:MAG: FGGY family carbohydrate kinase [Candidatus Woesearchaeota archaeon]
MADYILTIDPGASNTTGILREYISDPGYIRPDIVGEPYTFRSGKWTGKHGIKCENAPIAMMYVLKKIPERLRRNIRAIAITSHGATQVPIDQDGEPIFGGAPSYDSHRFGEFHDEFFYEFGDGISLLGETGSPQLDLGINAAQQMFYLKRKHPRLWDKTTHFLPLSSYMAFLLTGNRYTCHTHTRNHAYLEAIAENPEDWLWSSVVAGLGLQSKMPGFIRPFDAYGTLTKESVEEYGLPKDCIVVAAGHDTSAASILAPNYINTGTWICNTAAGVPIDLSPQFLYRMEEIGLAVNADPWGRNLRTIMARYGQTREEYRKMFDPSGKLQQECKFNGLNCVGDEIIPLAFNEGVGPYPSLETAELPEEYVGKASSFLHSLSFTIAIPEVLSSILTSDDKISLHDPLSKLLRIGYKAKPVVIGGPFVAPLETTQGMGTFEALFSMLYPGTVKKFTFPEPTTYAAHIMAVAALEGYDPRELSNRIYTPTADITSKPEDESQLLAMVVSWEEEMQRLAN